MKKNKPAPTIRGSAQARLLLYQLISQKLNLTMEELQRHRVSHWENILEKLEADITNDQHKMRDLALLREAFNHIDHSTKRDLDRQFKSVVGASLYIGSGPTHLLESFIKEHTQLIKAVRSEHLQKIGQRLTRGIRQGSLQKDLAKEIKLHTNMSKKRAQLIARNAPLQYSGALTKHHQATAGIKRYRWQTSQDERVRASHEDRDGEVYSWDDPGPHPREEVNCRCDAVPVLEG